MITKKPLIFLIVLFLVLPFSQPISYTSLQALHSLSHSLMVRVSNIRASRGDQVGSDRARFIANKMDRAMGLGFWKSMVSLSWDYLKNYAFRDGNASMELFGAVRDMNELIGLLNEFRRMGSQRERDEWVTVNYRNALRASNSLFRRLLKFFHHSGPLRQLVETVQKEVVEGDLLRDCLELGSNDLNGVIQIMKDVALQFSSNSDHNDL